ncbi:MAG: hypothetical protein JRH20_28890 [Deltaproteobacteria bacterium]|nr:hypothetical protein [Deltaproteobacteria bacterium]
MTRFAETTILLALGIFTLSACGARGGDHERQHWRAPTDKAPSRQFKSVVNTPSEQLGMATPRRNIRGERLRVPCGTCHHLVPAKKLAKANTAAQPRRFHKAQVISHGDLMCQSCHRAPLFNDFRLSSGKVVPYADVMQLCGQCHSRQLKDYRHGAHGGMRGYWDLDRGPRTRNHCLDCHNPHHPAIPKVMPAPLPRNRFQGSEGGKT